MSKNNVCDLCQGSGHDSNSRPVVVSEVVNMPGGTKKRRHITKKRGSGCMKCLGRGVQGERHVHSV